MDVNEFPEKPERPLDSDCCGNGCVPCVMDIYEEELKIWEQECLKLQGKGNADEADKDSDDDCCEEESLLSLGQYRNVKVISITQETRDSWRYRLKLPKGKSLGLRIGQHIIIRGHLEGSPVTRQYTPISDVGVKGHFDLLIKIYPSGKMSQVVHKWKEGDRVDIRGPFGSLEYSRNKRQSFLKKLYRAPIDWLEEKTTGLAHCILVNSNFTAGVFKDTFGSLSHLKPEVLYPIPDFTAFDKPVEPPSDDLMPPNKKLIFLSINRYERKKNLGLAIEAFGQLSERNPETRDIHLIMAGGYDDRVLENVEHYLELRHLAERLHLTDNITFLRSFSDAQKRTLLSHSSCLLYTPDREHFGIVPIEAMYMKCPVIAVKSGGPLETVEDKKTGFLCDPNPESFSEAMEKFLKERSLGKTMGEAGKERVKTKFSFEQFTAKLHNIVIGLLSAEQNPK